jgi:hypothetical protein
VAGPLTPKQSFDEPRDVPQQPAKPLVAMNEPPIEKEKTFEGPKRRPTIVNNTKSFVNAEHSAKLEGEEEEVVAPRPPLRRKTSKFIEHIDVAFPETNQSATISPPLPFLPPFDFQLTTLSKTAPKDPRQQAKLIKRSASSSRKPSVTFAYPEPSPTASTPESRFLESRAGEAKRMEARLQAKLEKAGLTSAPKPPPRQPRPDEITRKRSASNIKAEPARVAVPVVALKRAATTRSRPTTQWGDLCMAEVKPVMKSPIVASGHARMVSC